MTGPNELARDGRETALHVERSYFAAVVAMPVISQGEGSDYDEIRWANSRRLVESIDAVMAFADPSPRLLVYPVQPLTGGLRATNPPPLADRAVELPGPFMEPVVEACRRHRCYLATSLVERAPSWPGRVFHTGFILGPNGIVLRSPKAQAPTASAVTTIRQCYEEYVATFGEDAVLPVAETELGVLACMLEGEIQVPEAARLVASRGAQVIAHPTGQFMGSTVPWGAQQQVLAYTNGVYLLSASRSRDVARAADGSEDEMWPGGRCAIHGPDGELIATLGPRGEGFVMARIDLDAIDRAREAQARYTEPASVLYQALYAPSD